MAKKPHPEKQAAKAHRKAAGAKRRGHPPHKPLEHAHSGVRLQKNVGHVSNEVHDLGDRIGRHIEERKNMVGRRQQPPSGHARENWYFRTFGIAGPFISSLFGMALFFVVIWLLKIVNLPIGSMFMSDLSAFLQANTGLFFLAFVLFSYGSFFSRHFERAYRPFSPVIVAAALTFALWLAASALSLANLSLANPVIFGTAYWTLRLLPAIFGAAIFMGYLVLIAKISVEHSEEGRLLRHVHDAHTNRHASIQADGIKRLYRSGKDSVLGGVCGGLGEYFRVDPVLFRLLFVILIFAWGMGILLYLVCWIFIPRNPYHKWSR